MNTDTILPQGDAPQDPEVPLAAPVPHVLHGPEPATASGIGAPQGSKGGFGAGAMLMMVCIAITSGVLGAVGYMRYQPAPVQPQAQVMVLDMAALVSPISNDPTLDDATKRAITTNLGQHIEALLQREVETNGTIVLDASAVLRAPQGLYLQPDGPNPAQGTGNGDQ